MNHRKALLEVMDAMSDFDRACLNFAEGMSRITASPVDPMLREIVRQLGAPQPARRAEAQAVKAFLRAGRRPKGAGRAGS